MPDERRTELLQAAMELFAEQGIEKTAVSDIVKRVGVAQGLFYYYFKSKEEMIEAVIDIYTDSIMRNVFDILKRKDYGFYEKLARCILLLSEHKSEVKIEEELHKPSNKALHKKAVTKAIQKITNHMDLLLTDSAPNDFLKTIYAKPLIRVLLYGLSEILHEENLTSKAVLSLAEQTLSIKTGSLIQFAET